MNPAHRIQRPTKTRALINKAKQDRLGHAAHATEEEEDPMWAGVMGRVVVDLTNSRHLIVRKAATVAGWVVEGKTENLAAPGLGNTLVMWSDMSTSVEKVSKLAAIGGKINHFPSIDLICRKVPLAANINRMKKILPKEYNSVTPKTFTDYTEFRQHKQSLVQEQVKRPHSTPAKKFYIVKPNNGCMGKGIYLTSNPSQDAFAHAVVQEYVNRPLLIEGRKFDMRCYVLVTSVTPPRIFFYNDGLVRLCSVQYMPVGDENHADQCMHLSNYSVNKKHKLFETASETGSSGGKRDFAFLTSWLNQNGHNADKFWASVHNLIVKTVLSVAPTLATAYSTAVKGKQDGFTCFELLGFDVLVNDTLEVQVCEVNHSPSLVTDTPFDAKLKFDVLHETMKLVALPSKVPNNLTPSPSGKTLSKEVSLQTMLGMHGVKKRNSKRRTLAEDAVLSSYRRVYPSEDPHLQASYRHILQVQTGVSPHQPSERRCATPLPAASRPMNATPPQKMLRTLTSPKPKRSSFAGSLKFSPYLK
eukprot:TRINITY_DN18_c2_g2_i1.p1 TRINITY_DN18_c2_g2~~TRINITY_DN18_c2_g2_i1.p1  ORF type:complete len:529 (+),score=77.46 TRINITY_DN18_c2_g2_i1:38-1624(+)